MPFVFTLLLALGSGIIAGVFFAFSTFVMKALTRLPHYNGIATMQSINIVVLNPWILVIFFGTALFSIIAMGIAMLRWNDPHAIYLLVGSIFYIVGCFLVTLALNVPKNNVLANIKLEAIDDAGKIWASYVSTWTQWNHVRTTAAAIASVCFILALTQ